MRKRFLAGAVAVAAVGITAFVPATASADEKPTLAEILTSDSAKDRDGFDRRFWDYDIVTQAINASGTYDLNERVQYRFTCRPQAANEFLGARLKL